MRPGFLRSRQLSRTNAVFGGGTRFLEVADVTNNDKQFKPSEAGDGLAAKQIVLASGSPRRKELLENLGFLPLVRTSDVPEQLASGETPTQYTRRLCEQKATAVAGALDHASLPWPWVLAADTVVVQDGEVLEKPADAAEARAMLGRLQDAWHQVVTSFCVLDLQSGEGRVESVTTDVRFRALSDEAIGHYAASGEPMDKAGAYGIQRLGSFLVREIRGSYFSVVGLPVCEVLEVLQEMGGLPVFPFPGTKA
ncbi:MAG: septum formation inhibitor Maf [Myxococcales bacterium]|nr:septum formation inhibitor Maf [Myxococcales bacterium]